MENEAMVIYDPREISPDIKSDKVTPEQLKVILTTLIKPVQAITVTDLADDEQIELVRDVKKNIAHARNAIKKQSKAMRDGWTQLGRANIQQEKDLLEIIVPEEDRLAGILDEADTLCSRAARSYLLPTRRNLITDIDGEVVVTDEELLDMDDKAFAEFIALKQAEKATKDAEEKQKREDAAKEAARIAQEKDDSFRSWKGDMTDHGAEAFVTIDGKMTAVKIIGVWEK
jgi:hypothetical protein